MSENRLIRFQWSWSLEYFTNWNLNEPIYSDIVNFFLALALDALLFD